MITLLLLTIAIECAALYILKERNRLFYLYWTAVTTVTNLCVNLYLIYLFRGTDLQYYITVGIIELMVFAVELALCYLYTSDKKKSLIYSAVCNLSSFIIGSVIQMILLIFI